MRYYGGVKLGVGGLINAYRNGAQLAIEASKIIQKTIESRYRLQFEYKHMGNVMRLIKENNLRITYQKLENNCLLEISVRKSKAGKINELFKPFFEIDIIEL